MGVSSRGSPRCVRIFRIGPGWFCCVSSGEVRPLVAAPGGRGAGHVIAEDATAFDTTNNGDK